MRHPVLNESCNLYSNNVDCLIRKFYYVCKNATKIKKIYQGWKIKGKNCKSNVSKLARKGQILKFFYKIPCIIAIKNEILKETTLTKDVQDLDIEKLPNNERN